MSCKASETNLELLHSLPESIFPPSYHLNIYIDTYILSTLTLSLTRGANIKGGGRNGLNMYL